ncbi:hypothetical protein KAR91_00585 [Candidatus Pacearchaeota archaeon]|nr:hypothetical protein [Candidatus Pacearchaeota archaeon]
MSTSLMNKNAFCFIGRTNDGGIEFDEEFYAKDEDTNESSSWDPEYGFNNAYVQINGNVYANKFLLRGTRMKKGSVRKVKDIIGTPCFKVEASIKIRKTDNADNDARVNGYLISFKKPGNSYPGFGQEYSIGCDTGVDRILNVDLYDGESLFLKDVKIIVEPFDHKEDFC